MSTKQDVLAALERERGRWLTGEELAAHSETGSLSRTAIWKAVNALKRDGYRIDAVTGKGYRLTEDNDILSREGIAPFCGATEPHIHVYSSVDSTNRVAKQLALEGAPHGTAVLAEEQTMGRGRRGRTFYSPAGRGLYMSVVLRPQLGLGDAMLVTAAAAVAACEAIEAVVPRRMQIKWVNDILLDGKKVCGILTEAVTDLETGAIDSLVLGIGVNCGGEETDFPAELQGVAGTIGLPGTGDATRNRLAGELLGRLARLEEEIRTRRFLAAYRERSAVIGKEIRVLTPDGEYPARAVDIDEAAGLIICREDGQTATLRAGEVSIRPR